MSQHIDLDAFRSGYKAKMGISDELTQEIVKTPAALPDVSAADDIDPDAITDLGDIEPLDITTHDGSKPVGLELPQEAVMGTLAAWRDTAQEEIDDVSQTLHTLRNSLKTDLYETKSLAEQSGLSFYVVDSDPAFARKKIESDTYAGMLRSFADNARDIPQTTAFLRETDTLERLALTGDEQLSILEKQLNADGGGFFNSGYIAAARNAWNTGMMSREIGDLANKWMAGDITEDERHRLDVLRDAQAYYQGRRDGMGLLERMVRGTVESVGTPLYGGLAGAAGMLGRYGKEGLAGGAMVGAGIGSAVGGVGAVPGAIAGGLTGMGAVAQTGFVNDMMRQEGGQTFLTLMDMGVPEDTARVLAIAAGGFKGALEYVGLKQIGKIFPGAENFLTQEAAGAALKALERNPSLLSAIGSGAVTALRGIAGEVATENLQDVVDIVAEDVGRRFAGGVKAPATVGEIAGRLWETTTQTLESVALLGGAGGIVRGVHNYTRNNQREDQLASLADNQKRIVDTVAQAVQSSPVMQNMGDTGEALIQHLSDNGVTPETLYLTPEIVQQVFFQSEDPALMAAAAEMGITPESLQENLTLGTDVAVPFSKASTHILKDPERYAALREDIRLSPAMPTDAELEELAAMNQDAEARLAYLDDLLAPVAEEVDAAQTRFEQRMGIAAPYVEQLRDAGYSENQANAYGLVLAANAERMAPVFGMTPQQYLQERFAGYYGMTQEEFTRLAQGGLEGLFENRDMAAMLQDMGIKKGMSATKRRRALQPEFGFAYGRINPESVQHLYGMQRYNELRQQFGPGFFAKKGEGLPIDVLAQNFEREERGGYDLPAGEIDADAFAEKIFSPHDEFESGLVDQLRQNVLWQPAFHGTPHRFDSFSTDAIGTGEGAQAHGWGLYFAGDRSVANGYRVGLGGAGYTVNGKDVNVLRRELEQKKDWDRLTVLDGFLAQNDTERMDWDDYEEDAVAWFKEEILPNIQGEGQLHAVDIPENDVLLDEDKKLNDQPVAVRTALQKLWTEALGYDKPTGEPNDMFSAYDGRRFYRELADRLGSAEAASRALNEAGVKGITYDGQQDGRCFVVFDDNAVKVLNTYYQSADNNSVVARISPEAASTMGLPKAGDFIARESDLAPIDQKHGEQFRSMGFANAREFVNHVIEQVDAVYKGGGSNIYIFVRRGERKSGQVVAEFEAQYENGRYRVTTAHPVRNTYFAKRTPLWERAPSSHSASGTPGAYSGQSGVENSITIPDVDGKPLFSMVSPGRARGAMTTLQDGRAIVGLFKSKNASTPLHETAHFWLEELRDAAQLDTAPEWVRDAWGKLQKAYDFEGFVIDDAAHWTQIQERFAREFEAYARDGKAPSWELQTAFNRFRNWLTEIYRSVRAVLGMDNISEDVRQVFDSLLATQEEIEQSQRAATQDSVMELLGEDEVTPELRDKYARAAQRAYENASAVIANRRLVERRAAEKTARKEATEAIDNSTTYMLLSSLRSGGIDFDQLKNAISEDVAYRLKEKWRGSSAEGKAIIRKDGELDLLDVAAQFDQDSIQGLAGVLLDTPTRREAINAEVERRMAEWDAQYDAEIEYSNAYDAAIAVELEALTGQKQPTPAQLRRQMDERTGVKKMSAVDAEYKALKARLQSDERAAHRAWNAATREANAAAREKIAAVKEQERLRRAALGAAYRARIERDNIVRQLRRIGNSKSVPYEYMCQIRRLLQRWAGLGTEGQRLDPETLRKLPSLQEFLASREAVSPFDEPVTVPDWLLENQAGRFGDLSLEQMRDVKRLVQELAHVGRNEGRMLADKEKREIKDVADACAAATSQLSQRKYVSDRAGVFDTIRGALRKGLSSLTSVRFLARALDGYADHGVNHDAWLMPLQKARSEELALQREMESTLRSALAPLLRVGKVTKAFTIDGVPLMQDVNRQWAGMWDMDKVYSVALNMGNEGNLKALMQGYGWGEGDLSAITGRLTAEEWKAIQSTWDAIDTLYPRLNEVYKTLKGVPLPKVKAKPFSVLSADGQVVQLKGGYYPLIFDQRLSDKAAENQSVDELLNGMEAVLRSPNPKSGMTKTRTGGTLPPKLSLTVIDRHVTDTIHYVTHALPLRDTMRLFREDSFKQAFINAAGQENYDQLLPWLRGIARPGGEQAKGMLAVMDWLARRGSMYALGANMKSALLQFTSIGNSWSEVGFGNFMRAAATMISSPRQSWATVREKSAYMQNRARLLDDTLRREYEDMRAQGIGGVRFRGVRYGLDTLRQAQMGLMISMDAAVAYPTWLAAYDKSIADGVDEATAIARADSAVIAAQGGGGPLDTPAVMRQAGMMRILCPFMSFALSDFNRKMETIRGFAEWVKTGKSSVTPARLFRDFALQWVTPVALSVLMVSLGRDGEPPEGEDFMWEALTFFTMGVPVVRDVAKAAEGYFSEHGYKGGRTPLMLAGLDNAVRGLGHAYKAWDEGDDDAEYRAMKELLNAAGFALGIGTPQIWRTLEGSEAFFVDGEGGVLAPLLGKPKDRR